MSAPQTNIEKQKRRHAGPLIGMIVVVAFAVGLLVWWLSYESAEAPGPTEEPAAAAGAPDQSTPGTPPATSVPTTPETATGQEQPPGGGSN